MKILVVKMNIPDSYKRYQVTQQQLLQLPKSRYRPDDYLEKSSSPQLEVVLMTSSIHGDSDATLPYSSSDATQSYSSFDETIPYWTLSDDNASINQSPLNKHKKIDSTTNIKGIKNQKKPSKHSVSAYTASGNTAGAITSNVPKQAVTELLTKCKIGTPTTA